MTTLMRQARNTVVDAPRPAVRSSRLFRYVLAAVAVITMLGWFLLAVIQDFRSQNSPRALTVVAGFTLLMAGAIFGIELRTGDRISMSFTQARTDDLTGLGNRRRLLEHLDRVLAVPDHAPIALLLIDLDRFKEINDSLGHLMGDELLRMVRPRFESTLRTGDLACRLGGDEFAIVLAGEAPELRATHVAQRIRASLMAPFLLGETEVFIDASIGICSAPLHAQTSEQMLKLADISMYEAKRQRLGVSVYRVGLDQVNNDRLTLANDLRQALLRDELGVFFQPKIDLRNNRLIGVEALVRWRHPTRGFVPPDEFLPLAEDTGQAAQVTTVVLDKALAQVSEWKAEGTDLRVSVNLYESDLRNEGVVKRISDALERHVLPPRLLQVEITEQSLMADPAGSRVVLDSLQRIGISVSLDDYGTGYSSLAYLREFPIDELKLDKTFALGMTSDHTSWVIVRSTIELAHALGMRIVAEGVEDETTRDELLTLNCDYGQGYYWSQALADKELNGWMRERGLMAGSPSMA